MLDKFYIEENSSNLILSSVYKDSYPRQKKKRKEGKLRSLIGNFVNRVTMIISLFKVDNDQRILSPFKPRTGTRPETPSDPWSSQIQPSRSSHTSFHATFSKMLSSTERNREKNPFTCTRITLPRDFTSHVLSTLSTPYNNIRSGERRKETYLR